MGHDPDELSAIMYEAGLADDPDCDNLTSAAESIVAAGYRKPRIITTIEELKALPEDSIVLDQDVTATKVAETWHFQMGVFEPNLPVVVLYNPKD